VRRRTLTVCAARAFAQAEGAESLIATMIGTLMALTRREPVKPQTGARIAGQ
jgi:hypothetical protein